MNPTTRDAQLRPDVGQAAGTTASTGPDPVDASTGELLTRLSSQLTALVKGELDLARAELTTKGKRAGVGARTRRADAAATATPDLRPGS